MERQRRGPKQAAQVVASTRPTPGGGGAAALRLQPLIGNQAVARMLTADRPGVVRRTPSGAQLTVQPKMAEITRMLRARFVAEGKLEEDEGADAAEAYAASLAVDGLCGGWVALFTQFPEWVEPVYNAVRTWVRKEGVSDADALEDFERHLASTTDVADHDRRGANHVVKLLRDAYATMRELEPDAGYEAPPDWTDVPAERNLWASPKAPRERLSVELAVTSASAAALVVEHLRVRLLPRQVLECMAHIESDVHHMAVRAQKDRKGGLTITVVETEKTGIETVSDWEAVEGILGTWFAEEPELRSVTVRTQRLKK